MGAVRMRVQTADKKNHSSSLNNPEPLNKLVSDKKKNILMDWLELQMVASCENTSPESGEKHA